MKKTYFQPAIKSLVYDKDIMQLPIHNSIGNGNQLSDDWFWDDEEEEVVVKKRKSVWD